ncbi:hypothetical protein RCC89_05005 [Cytophagaceae bacterium ABcell3]|nr:hypothetical protein RCC89_05005 [Cytophagaceae bacterium ABcell3]
MRFFHLFIFISLCCACPSLYGQVSTNGVKVISEQDKNVLLQDIPEREYNTELKKVNQPDESAILEIYSKTQGVLFPSLSYSQMVSIQEPSDGLTVFVTDSDRQGFHIYYRNNGWLKLSEEENIIALPNGGVIMYYGEVDDFDESGLGRIGSSLEGWAICNGNNGTPDLRSMFTVMAVDPSVHNISGRESSLTSYGLRVTSGKQYLMEDAHLPAHKHALSSISVNAPHTHVVYEDEPHKHHIETSTKRSVSDISDGRPLRRFTRVKKKWGNQYRTIATNESTLANVVVSSAVDDVRFELPAEIFKATPESASGQMPINNRPAYTALLYIMKVNFLLDENCYQQYRTLQQFD